jgi:broad specificity phosphatase PhoE
MNLDWPEILVLVRHAESDGNVVNSKARTKINKGSQNYGITERGFRQLDHTRDYLNERFAGGFDVILSSYYKRSNLSMRHLYPGRKVVVDTMLSEAQRGIWHVLTEDEARENHEHEITRKKREGNFHYRPLGGENWVDIEMRSRFFAFDLRTKHARKKVIAGTHGNWQLLFEGGIHGHSIQHIMRRYERHDIDNASVTIYKRIVYRGEPKLKLVERNIVPWQGKV